MSHTPLDLHREAMDLAIQAFGYGSDDLDPRLNRYVPITPWCYAAWIRAMFVRLGEIAYAVAESQFFNLPLGKFQIATMPVLAGCLAEGNMPHSLARDFWFATRKMAVALTTVMITEPGLAQKMRIDAVYGAFVSAGEHVGVGLKFMGAFAQGLENELDLINPKSIATTAALLVGVGAFLYYWKR